MAQSQLPALVLGETGVGKEHVARLIHDSSARRERPFVTINCAAIPAELLESELFGIGRGVATGVSERAGKFREAHGGTLFLDEVGELPLPLQAKLLRALEEKKVQPLGGPATDVDLRIVAASNTRLDSAAERGDFRLDLYYRLAGLIVEVAPLRERAEDVPLLFEHFLREAAAPPPRLLPRALSALVRHRWEGNVRELRHEATRVAAVVGAGGAIDLEDLSPRVAASFAGEDAAAAEGAPRDASLDAELRRLERSLIGDAVAAAGGNLSEAARALGVSRTRLYRHLAASARPRR
jgi:transcriptional regulator with PAS, ATPase and Fis domain